VTDSVNNSQPQTLTWFAPLNLGCIQNYRFSIFRKIKTSVTGRKVLLAAGRRPTPGVDIPYAKLTKNTDVARSHKRNRKRSIFNRWMLENFNLKRRAPRNFTLNLRQLLLWA